MTQQIITMLDIAGGVVIAGLTLWLFRLAIAFMGVEGMRTLGFLIILVPALFTYWLLFVRTGIAPTFK